MLAKQCADADAFPAGTVFCSKCGDVTGELTMLNLVPGDDDDEVDFLVGDGDETERPTPEPRRELCASPKPAPARASDESSGERRVFLESRGDAAA